jgi:hypothetical protein
MALGNLRTISIRLLSDFIVRLSHERMPEPGEAILWAFGAGLVGPLVCLPLFSQVGGVSILL